MGLAVGGNSSGLRVWFDGYGKPTNAEAMGARVVDAVTVCGGTRTLVSTGLGTERERLFVLQLEMVPVRKRSRLSEIEAAAWCSRRTAFAKR